METTLLHDLGLETMPRWYDEAKYSSIKNSIGFLKQLPDDILSIVAEGVVLVAEDEFSQGELKAIGVEKVMALHKSKHKSRAEDQNQYLHKTVNYLTIMSEDNRLVLGEHLSNLCSHTINYFKLCKEFEKSPEKNEINGVVKTYVKEGNETASKFLTQLKQEFLNKLNERSKYISTGHSTDMQVGIKQSQVSRQVH